MPSLTLSDTYVQKLTMHLVLLLHAVVLLGYGFLNSREGRGERKCRAAHRSTP